MPDDLFCNKYRIPSARAVWHDYNGGAYFVTICTKDMAHFFGEIVDGEMCLTEIGRCADEQLRNVSSHYPYAKIPLWVVMPNHVHAIVMIDGDADLNGRDAIYRVSGDVMPSDTGTVGTDAMNLDAMNRVSTGGVTHNNNPMLRKCLGAIVRGLKARVTKYANENGISFAWQTRFYERIIRDCDEMNGIAGYIENNVAKWKSDEMNDE
jgi:REP element-mobilizing transposase RayT